MSGQPPLFKEHEGIQNASPVGVCTSQVCPVKHETAAQGSDGNMKKIALTRR